MIVKMLTWRAPKHRNVESFRLSLNKEKSLRSAPRRIEKIRLSPSLSPQHIDLAALQ